MNIKIQIVSLMKVGQHGLAIEAIDKFLNQTVEPQDQCWAFINRALCNMELDLFSVADRDLKSVDSILSTNWNYPANSRDSFSNIPPKNLKRKAPSILVNWFYYAVGLHLTKQGEYNMAKVWLTSVTEDAPEEVKRLIKEVLDYIPISQYNVNIAKLEKSLKV